MREVENPEKRPKRPRGVTILVLSVLIIAVFFTARVYQAVRLKGFIENLDPGVSPAYLVLTGLVFSLAGLPVLLGLWTGKAWASSAAKRYFIALAAYYWLDTIFFVVSDSVRGNWPFALGTTILVLAWVHWVLTSRPSVDFFKLYRGGLPENGDRNVE